MKSSPNLPQIRRGSRSVSRVLSGTVIHLGRTSPHASSDLPGGRRGSRRAARKAQPAPLFGLAPGGVYPAAPLTRNAVRSYRTFSPLPRAGCRQTRGGIFSVALSVDSRPPGVTWHPTLRSPDFPPRRQAYRLPARGDCLIDSRTPSLCTLSRGCKRRTTGASIIFVGASLLANTAGRALWKVRGQGRSYNPGLR